MMRSMVRKDGKSRLDALARLIQWINPTCHDPHSADWVESLQSFPRGWTVPLAALWSVPGRVKSSGPRVRMNLNTQANHRERERATP